MTATPRAEAALFAAQRLALEVAGLPEDEQDAALLEAGRRMVAVAVAAGAPEPQAQRTAAVIVTAVTDQLRHLRATGGSCPGRA